MNMQHIDLSETFLRWADVGGLVRSIGLYAVVDRAALSDKPAYAVRRRWEVIDLAQEYHKSFESMDAAIAHLLTVTLTPKGWDHV